MFNLIKERHSHISTSRMNVADMLCEKTSVAGSVSQRACVFCGSRVVLYPIADAVHLVHGPIGCAVYTWDIRGALSSGPELHRMSFSTDLSETDIIHGGEKKLYQSLTELINRYNPKAAFVYSTCIVGLIGDDIDAICKRASNENSIPVVSVHSEGFKGTKKDGYYAACKALLSLMKNKAGTNVQRLSVNILGEFNIAGEMWIIRKYFSEMGIDTVASITGDGRVEDISRAPNAALNVVQCSGSMMYLAKMMEEKYGTPYIRVSYFGIEDMSRALYDIADFFNDTTVKAKTEALVKREVSAILPELKKMRSELNGKKAAIYTGGAFKAFSLVRSLRTLGIETAIAGSQTGNKEDYQTLSQLCEEGTILVDDTNPLELSQFIAEKNVDLFIGGVKERPIAYKLGIGFCDHNHERKIPLAGFEGMLNFAREVYETVMSPIWRLMPRHTHSEGMFK